jgi:hypothetical protein
MAERAVVPLIKVWKQRICLRGTDDQAHFRCTELMMLGEYPRLSEIEAELL